MNCGTLIMHFALCRLVAQVEQSLRGWLFTGLCHINDSDSKSSGTATCSCCLCTYLFGVGPSSTAAASDHQTCNDTCRPRDDQPFDAIHRRPTHCWAGQGAKPAATQVCTAAMHIQAPQQHHSHEVYLKVLFLTATNYKLQTSTISSRRYGCRLCL